MKTKDSSFLMSSWAIFNHLPLEYNSALYSRIFDESDYYFTSGLEA